MPPVVGLLLVVAGLFSAQGTPAAPPPAGRAASNAASAPEPRAPNVNPAAVQGAAAALHRWVRQSGGKVGVVVLDPEDGREVAAVAAAEPLNPASNAKLFTAAVALRRLGAQYRYVTGLYGEVRGDHIDDLVLRGTGDPSLTVDDLEGLCRTLVGMGVRRIEGRILVDGSRFDPQTVPPAFDQQPNEWASFRAPVSAVALERNTVIAHVLPKKKGEPARVWFDPPGVVAQAGSFQTVPVGRGQDLRIDWRELGTGIEARLAGTVAEGLPKLSFARRLDDPTLVSGRVLKHLLQQVGISVRGEVAVGGQGVRRRLASHRSAPLGHLLAELGKASDNFYAEMVFKTLGVGPKGEPATFGRAASVISDWVRSAGIPDAGLRITNGSGLFDANRASARTIAETLAAALRDPAIGSEYVAQLAVGGVDGTLSSRFRTVREARFVRAKTGTLAKVDALSGYAFIRGRSTPLVFSILVNGISDHPAARRRIDRVVESIVDPDPATRTSAAPDR